LPIARTTRPTNLETRFGEIRPIDFDQIERVLYGPVHVVDGKVEWEIAEGGWPREWVGERTGDWIEQIKREIARGAWDLGQRFQIRTQTDRGEQIVEGWEFAPPGVDVDADSIDQEDQAAQLPGELSEFAPAVRANSHDLPEDVAIELPETEASDGRMDHAQHLGSLGIALALVQLGTKRAQEGTSPAQVASAMDRMDHRGFSPARRCRRLVEQLRNIASL
jgi:hypothetical protein